MGEGGLQVVFAISCKNNLSDVSVPPFNVTDCSIVRIQGLRESDCVGVV